MSDGALQARHAAAVERLLDGLNGLVDAGRTVIVIERNLEVIKCADDIADMGPEDGADGGELVACGTTGISSHEVPHGEVLAKRVEPPERGDR
jgi:excinuclease UvrABC ATPase subunit